MAPTNHKLYFTSPEKAEKFVPEELRKSFNLLRMGFGDSSMYAYVFAPDPPYEFSCVACVSLLTLPFFKGSSLDEYEMMRRNDVCNIALILRKAVGRIYEYDPHQSQEENCKNAIAFATQYLPQAKKVFELLANTKDRNLSLDITLFEDTSIQVKELSWDEGLRRR